MKKYIKPRLVFPVVCLLFTSATIYNITVAVFRVAEKRANLVSDYEAKISSLQKELAEADKALAEARATIAAMGGPQE